MLEFRSWIADSFSLCKPCADNDGYALRDCQILVDSRLQAEDHSWRAGGSTVQLSCAPMVRFLRLRNGGEYDLFLHAVHVQHLLNTATRSLFRRLTLSAIIGLDD